MAESRITQVGRDLLFVNNSKTRKECWNKPDLHQSKVQHDMMGRALYSCDPEFISGSRF